MQIAKISKLSNDTTNRVKGFFGILIKKTQHKIPYFSQLFELIIRHSEIQFIKSQQPITLTIDERIISEEDASSIGSIALKKINEEFESINQENIHHLATAYNPNTKDCLCNFIKVYKLPCRHMIAFLMLNNAETPLFSLQQFEKRYLHT